MDILYVLCFITVATFSLAYYTSYNKKKFLDLKKDVNENESLSIDSKIVSIDEIIIEEKSVIEETLNVSQNTNRVKKDSLVDSLINYDSPFKNNTISSDTHYNYEDLPKNVYAILSIKDNNGYQNQITQFSKIISSKGFKVIIVDISDDKSIFEKIETSSNLFDNIIFQSKQKNLSYVSFSKNDINNLGKNLLKLKRQNDLVLIYSNPLPSDSTILSLKNFDKLVLVSDLNPESIKSISSNISLIKEHINLNNSEFLGVILNKYYEDLDWQNSTYKKIVENYPYLILNSDKLVDFNSLDDVNMVISKLAKDFINAKKVLI